MKNELRDPRGTVTTAHSAITATATSAAINCNNFNSILIDFTISGAANWTISITGCDTVDGTYRPVYANNAGTMAAMSYQLDSNRIFHFKGVPNFIKVVATEDVNGQTVTVKAQPINL